MSDLPLEGRVVQKDEKTEAPLSLEQRVEILERDLREIARGVNVQASLLESIVVSFDKVVQKYLHLIRTNGETDDAKDKN